MKTPNLYKELKEAEEYDKKHGMKWPICTSYQVQWTINEKKQKINEKMSHFFSNLGVIGNTSLYLGAHQDILSGKISMTNYFKKLKSEFFK